MQTTSWNQIRTLWHNRGVSESWSKRIYGPHWALKYSPTNINEGRLFGNCTHIFGEVSNDLEGDISGLRGEVTHLNGTCTGYQFVVPTLESYLASVSDPNLVKYISDQHQLSFSKEFDRTDLLHIVHHEQQNTGYQGMYIPLAYWVSRFVHYFKESPK